MDSADGTSKIEAIVQALESADGKSKTNTTMGEMAACPSSVASKGDFAQGPLEMDSASCDPKVRFTRVDSVLQVELVDLALRECIKTRLSIRYLERELTTSSVKLPLSSSWLRAISHVLY